MATVKRLVCLANSKKLSERCVAGKEVGDNRPSGWIRPVSAREHGEVSRVDRMYADRSDPNVRDLMDVQLLEPRPKDYQQENWLLDPATRWRCAGRASWELLQRLVDPPEPLWIDGHSTMRGENDEIPLGKTVALRTSLRLIRVDRLTLSVFNHYGRRKVQGQFEHAGTHYRLYVTDPTYEIPYAGRPDGNYKIGECIMTISLSEPFLEQNACYKLIAAIIEPDQDDTK